MAPEGTKIWNLDGSCSAEKGMDISGQHDPAKTAGPWSGLPFAVICVY